MIKLVGLLFLLFCGVLTGQSLSKREHQKYINGENMIWLVRCMMQAVQTERQDMLYYVKNENMAVQWDFLTVFCDHIYIGNHVKHCYFTAKTQAKLALFSEIELQMDRFFTEFGTLSKNMQVAICESTINACEQILQASKSENSAKVQLYRKLTPLLFAAVAVVIV